MNNYIDINSYISYEFKSAFYADTGRPRECSLHGYISALILQKIFTIPTDTLLIIILKLSSELRHFCGINLVPDASKFTRFKQDFCKYLESMFNDLVEITEPICQAIDPELADILSSDTSAVESYVTENNAKYINSLIKKLKSYFKFSGISKSDDDIYKQAYKSMPKVSETDPTIRKMYANGHFCYGRKFGIITNGLGIPRHIQFFDEEFKSKHSDFIFEDTDSPDYDKTLSDSKSLKPMLTDFYALHPNFSHKVFLGDSAYDAAHVYDFLLTKNSDGKRSSICEQPCSDSKYGRVFYTYPEKNIRLYPGAIRGTDEWNKLYKIRVVVEKAINHIKTNMGIAGRKTRNAKTTKADVFLAGIAQLFTVIIADNMAKPEHIRSIKKLAC